MSDKPKIAICPYCGNAQHATDRCEVCRGLFEPLSRRATQIAMGPWYIRDGNPHLPGCSFEMVKRMVAAGRIVPNTIMRGPTTRQFWTVARKVPGVAVLLGYCDSCNEHVEVNARRCGRCGNALRIRPHRNELGLQYTSDAAAEAAQRALEHQIRGTNGGGKASSGKSHAPATATPRREKPAREPGVGANLLDEIFDDEEAGEGSPSTRRSTLLAFDRAEVATLPGENELGPVHGSGEEPAIPPELLDDRPRRRVRRRPQDRTMLGLLVATNVAMLIALVALVVILTRDDSPPQLPSAGEPVPDVVTTLPRETDVGGVTAPSGDEPLPEFEPSMLEDPIRPPTPPRVTPPTTPPPALPSEPQRVSIPAIEQAQTLAEAKQFREAIAVLRRYQNETPAAEQPDDLPQLIAHLEEQARKQEIEEMGFFE